MIKTQAIFDDYKGSFVQRLPFYGVKMPGRAWTTKKKALSDLPVLAHLKGKYATAVLAKWYPEFLNLDIDDREAREVEDIRAALGLDSDNSMLCASESENSYHLLLKPEYNGEPPTTNLLQSAMKGFSMIHNIEVFPKANKCIRLPFGPVQDCLDFEYSGLKTWQDKLFWFNKLDNFDLGTVKGHQLSFDLKVTGTGQMPTIMEEAQKFLSHGLQMPSSREHAQFCILLYLFRQNMQQRDAEGLVWQWIQAKSNGFSKDIRFHPGSVRKHIQRQADRIWSDYTLSLTYPDRTHNQTHGYITEPDIREILIITRAAIPKSKMFFYLLKYSYPRRYQTFIPVHSDLLRTWSRSEVKYLNELEAKGVLKRGKSYQVDRYSKDIKLNWKYKTDNAVLFEGRSVDTFEDTIKLLYKPPEFKGMLEGAGATRQAAYKAVKGIYGPKKV